MSPVTPDEPTQAPSPGATASSSLGIPVRVELPAEDADAPASRPRGTAGRYVIHDELGRGGMGVVYRAFDRDLRRFVAMKVMHAIRLDPKEPTAWLNRADVRVARGDRAGAIADFERALELDPEDDYARTRLAELRAGK